MSDLPKSVTISEDGPREGFQMESAQVSTGDKVRLIDALSETGLKHIEVTSFANPKWIPQMADADDVSARFCRTPGVSYSVLALNPSGVVRARLCGKFDSAGPILVIASDTVSMSNVNKKTEQALANSRTFAEAVNANGFPLSAVVANAFGCNVEGDIPPSRVLSIIGALLDLSQAIGTRMKSVGLADTVGVANPLQVKRLVHAVRDRFPGIDLFLHLHDTRGSGMANVYAALESGISQFDTSIGGLGGCPHACGAAGNVATEDVALMCEEMGIDTGLDLEKLFKCARMAEGIVGHTLPGKAKVGGLVKHKTP